jgi:hypothetical protein
MFETVIARVIAPAEPVIAPQTDLQMVFPPRSAVKLPGSAMSPETE